MGRALKIQKNNVGAGTSVAGSNPVVTLYNQTVLADAGFPNFGSLTNPAYNTPVQTLDSTQFLGVVGGSPATSTASATFPEISALVNILLVNGTDSQTATSSYTGRLIRQKGSHKFLVAATGAAIADESFVVGQAYQVSTLGTTNWAAVGAGTGVAVGDIFTATAAGAGTGEAYIVGQCVLSNTATPTAGNMSIQYSTGDSTAVFASYITNKWVRDWNGMTYGNYSNSNFGQNIQSNENQYVANFFTDEGNVTVSGGELSGTTSVDNPTIQLAQIASVTS